MVSRLRALLLSVTLGGLALIVVGCSGSSTTANKMNDKMSGEKMGGDKMGK